MRVVLDTNVLISGLLFSGPPSMIIQAWRNGKIEILVSPEILEEYYRVAEELTSESPGVDLRPVVDFLAARAKVIEASALSEPVCTDPDDDKFLACAIAGKAEVICSGDKALLKASDYRGVRVIKPRTFVDRFLK